MTKLKEEEVKVSLSYAATIDNLAEMLTFIKTTAKDNGVKDNYIKKLELASEEAIVNVIHHAYQDKPERIQLECVANKNSFSVQIIDTGKPFDPVDRQIVVDKDLPIEQRKIGGLGIYLIRELMDEIVYCRNDDRNHLILTVRF